MKAKLYAVLLVAATYGLLAPLAFSSRAAQGEKSRAGREEESREKREEHGREARGRKTRESRTSVLGIRLESSIEDVHRRLKSLCTIGGRDTRDGGRREGCTLTKTEFSSVAYQTDKEGRVRWVTGFVRPGKEIPFSKLGDLARASYKNDSQVIWNIETGGGESYRLMAKGPGGKARVVSLISLGQEED
ncbi:MAG: hypothetical protein WCD76_12245 [Pyrinomonadaceae bacterium]